MAGELRMVLFYFIVFFFSSRRRHTRYIGDWSSDVCSSDLVKGDVVEIFPAYGENPFRIEFFGDEVEKISETDPVTGKAINRRTVLPIYPAKHYVMPETVIKSSIQNIREELRERLVE